MLVWADDIYFNRDSQEGDMQFYGVLFFFLSIQMPLLIYLWLCGASGVSLFLLCSVNFRNLN